MRFTIFHTFTHILFILKHVSVLSQLLQIIFSVLFCNSISSCCCWYAIMFKIDCCWLLLMWSYSLFVVCPACKNKYNTTTCDSIDFQCNINPGWMLANCTRTCFDCTDDIVRSPVTYFVFMSTINWSPIPVVSFTHCYSSWKHSSVDLLIYLFIYVARPFKLEADDTTLDPHWTPPVVWSPGSVECIYIILSI